MWKWARCTNRTGTFIFWKERVCFSQHQIGRLAVFTDSRPVKVKVKVKVLKVQMALHCHFKLLTELDCDVGVIDVVGLVFLGGYFGEGINSNDRPLWDSQVD